MRRIFVTAAMAFLLCASAEAQVKISDLPSGTPTTTDVVPFVAMSGTPATKKTTISDLFAAFSVTPSAVPSANKQGNGSKFQLFTGSASANDCAKFDASGNLVSAGGPCAASGLTSLNGQTGAAQTFADADDANVTLTIGSAANAHTFTLGWAGTLPLSRGGTNAADAAGARTNLGLGTAAVLNAPASGDAASGEAVKGDDSRLTNSRTPSGGAGGVLSGSYPSPGFAVDMATQGELDTHTSDTSNPHAVTKAQVGLGNVTNDAQLKAASNLSDLANPAAARTNLGLGSAATASSSDFAAASHAHSGSDITSGTVPVARGGTGQSSYTDGQLLIGTSTGNTLTKATLTAGSGISVTNGAGSITVAADDRLIAHLTNSANVTAGNGAWVEVTWDTEARDTLNFHSTVSNAGRVTPSVAGCYDFEFGGQFAANSTGARFARILKNGTDAEDEYNTRAVDIYATRVKAGTAVCVNGSTDYITVEVFQNSGAGLDILASSASSPLYLKVKRLGN